MGRRGAEKDITPVPEGMDAVTVPTIWRVVGMEKAGVVAGVCEDPGAAEEIGAADEAGTAEDTGAADEAGPDAGAGISPPEPPPPPLLPVEVRDPEAHKGAKGPVPAFVTYLPASGYS